MVKAVFFDVDGTLVSFKTHRVAETVEQALIRLRQRGIKVFINTGRMYSLLTNVRHIAFDGYVCYNGACLLDGGGRVVYSDPMPLDDLGALKRYEAENPFPLVFLQETEMVANMEHPDITWLAGHINVPVPRVATLDEIFRTPVYQFCAFLDGHAVSDLIGKAMPDCVAAQWTHQFFDVNMAHISKSTGMERMLALHGLAADEAMAFGDGGNDVPMIRDAGIGVAMGNATVEAKAAANYVAGGVDEDGVVEALAHFGLI